MAMSGITVGTLAEHREPPLARAFGLEAVALVALWLGIAPMLVAACFGLLV